MTAIVVPAVAVVCVVGAGYYYLKFKHEEAVNSIPVPKLPVDNRIEQLPEPSYLKANKKEKTEKKGEGTKKKKKDKSGRSGREEDQKKDDKKSGRAGEEDKKKDEKKSRKAHEEDKKKNDKKDDHKEEKKDDKKEKQSVI